MSLAPPNPMDIVQVDVNAPMDYGIEGANAIQLPEGVGELIPNLLFIGPHTACEEMVKRFGVRYIVDVLEDKEVVSTVRDSGYAAKSVELEAAVKRINERIEALSKDEEKQSNAAATDDEAAEAVADGGNDTAAGTGTHAEAEDDDGDDDTTLPPPPSADPSVARPDADLSVEESLKVKKRYLQLVADLRTATKALEELERRKVQYDAMIAALSPPIDGTPAPSCSDNAHALGEQPKKRNDYVRYQDCNVVSPVTAAEGYEVTYPQEVSLLHLHMRDALIEDLAAVLNMGKKKATQPSPKKKTTAGGDDECAADAKPYSPNTRGPNGFVTMEEMLAEFPPPIYDPPYALIDYLDAIMGENPSECDLNRLAIAAGQQMREQLKQQHLAATPPTAALSSGASSPNGNSQQQLPPPPPFNVKPNLVRHAVFVHCYAGKSRSASVALSYAMLSNIMGHKQLDELMEHIAFTTPLTIKRPHGYYVRKGQGCHPNPRFMRDLVALEEGVQTALQGDSGIPTSRRRPFETAFDMDTFNVEGLLELFGHGANPKARIPEAVIIDTYEKVCEGDVIKARRLLLAEQTRLLISPQVRQEMYIDNILRVLDQDIDYYMLERQKIVDGASYDDKASAHGGAEESPADRKKRLEARLKSCQVSTPRQLVASVLEQCDFNEEKALAKLRAIRDDELSRQMRS